MKRWSSSFLLFSLILVRTPIIAMEPEIPLYVGEESCHRCHVDAGIHCPLAPIPEHARSYESLKLPAAKEIAALSGISGTPTNALVCLECHSAGADDGPRWWERGFRPQAGVQCETCHGPRSLHVQSRTASPAPDPLGLASESVGRGNAMSCTVCHIDRASHREVLRNGFSRRPQDFLYKTPVSLVVSPDGERLFVVCERSDSVMVANTADGGIVGEIKVGHHPQSAALDPSGRTLYVSNTYSGTVSVIDVAQLRETEQIRVGSEPRGLTVDAQGRFLYVANSGEDSITVIDLQSRTEVRRLSAGCGPWSIAMDSTGSQAAVTSIRPNPARFRDPPVSELTVIDLFKGRVSARRMYSDANMLHSVAWIPHSEVALVVLMRTKNLIPATRLAQGWMITNGLGILWPDGSTDQILLDNPDDAFPDPMSVTASPDGKWALVTSGGGDEVAVVDVERLLQTVRDWSAADRLEGLPTLLGTSAEFVLTRVPVGVNPRDAKFTPDGRYAYVCNALSDDINVIDAATWSVIRTIPLPSPKELTPLRNGERLFHSASCTFGRQFSCRSCHPDGHLNGLTFDIEADGPGLKPVDNRTLRGIFDTAPFKWEGTNPSLARQCGARFATFFTRQAPFAPNDLDCLVHYMATIERSPNRFRDPAGLTLPQRKGKLIYERTTHNDGTPLIEQDRCNYCHNGGYRTNRQKFAVATTMWFDAPVDTDLSNLFNADEFGELGTYFFLDAGMPSIELDVPQLTDLASGAPYLHNGAARTLDEIWSRYNMANRHGATKDLTRQQFNDLIAYLKAQ